MAGSLSKNIKYQTLIIVAFPAFYWFSGFHRNHFSRSHSIGHSVVIQRRAGNVRNSENQRCRPPTVCRIVGVGASRAPATAGLGAFQLVGSFPGCHRHRPHPSPTILRQRRCLSLKQLGCRFAELWNRCSWLWLKQIESVEKEFPQQHSPPSNFGTTPQKPYDALKCTALHDVLHFRSEGAAAGMSVHAQYNVIQFIWMNCVQCKAVPYTRVQWRKVYCSSATVHCTVYIIQLYTVVYSSIHTDSTQHTVTVLAELEPAWKGARGCWLYCWHASWERGRGSPSLPPTICILTILTILTIILPRRCDTVSLYSCTADICIWFVKVQSWASVKWRRGQLPVSSDEFGEFST